MEVNFLLFSKATVQILLFFLFLAFFGLPSYDQYQKEETLVIKTELETQGIEVPAVTIQVINVYIICYSYFRKSVILEIN